MWTNLVVLDQLLNQPSMNNGRPQKVLNSKYAQEAGLKVKVDIDINDE